MGKLFRFYNRNNKKIWTVVIIIAFIFLLRNTLNQFYKDKNKEVSDKKENIVIKDDKYENQSESLVSGKKVSENYQDKFGKLVDSFLIYCTNHEPERAYGLLSNDCKSILYPTQEVFQKKYYNNRFNGDKKYSFKSWTSNDQYVYLVKVFDNMLATGKSSDKDYMQDYITVVKEGNDYKLNIDNFVGKKVRNKEIKVDTDLSIEVKYSEIFMDYEITEFVVKNYSNNIVIMDSRKNSDTVYLVDSSNIKFEALTYENGENDFRIYPNEEKKIRIKYTNPYRDKKKTEKYIFSDVYFNGKVKNIEIDLHK